MRPGLDEFIERVRYDEEVRRQVEEAEREATVRSQELTSTIQAVSEQNWEALRQIADAYGYDITPNVTRPRDLVAPTEAELDNFVCLLTCCWVATSALDTWDIVPTIYGPECAFSHGG